MLYSADPMLLRARVEQTCKMFFRDEQLVHRLTEEMTNTVFEVLKANDEEVRQQVKIYREALDYIDRFDGMVKEDK